MRPPKLVQLATHVLYRLCCTRNLCSGRGQLKCDGTCAETRFRLTAKRTSPFKLAGASVQSKTRSRGVRISGSNAGYTTFRDSVRVLATHSIRQFPLHFSSRASPCAITFQLESSTCDVSSPDVTLSAELNFT